MQRPSAAVRLYVTLVGALGIALLVFLFPQYLPGLQSNAMLLVFTALVLLADLNPVWLPQGAIVSVSTALNFSNTIIFGPTWATWAGAVAVVGADLRQGRPWYKIIFNLGCTALSVGLGGLVYFALQEEGVQPLGSQQNVMAAVAYTLTNFVLNSLLLSFVIGLDQRVRPLQVWVANSRNSLLQYAVMIPIGILIASAYLQYSLWSALLLVLLLIIVYNSLRISQELRSQTRSVMEALADVVDKRDPYTDRHSQEVADLVARTARRMQLSLDAQEAIGAAARVHDLGKIAIRDAVLLKPGRLDAAEMEEMRQHPVVGAQIVSRLALYRRNQELVLYHQERFDGRGYPKGLKGKDIPIGARIIAVADAYQAMTSDRPYRVALSRERAVSELLAGKGTQFDPEVVDAFLAAITEETATVRAVAEAKGTPA